MIMAESSVITGTSSINFLGDGNSSTNQIVNAGNGDDVIITGSGDDVVRAGLGDDRIFTKSGNDTILIVGETGENEYEQAEIESILSDVLSLDTLNGQAYDEAGMDTIDGGEGIDSLVIYGKTDLTGITIRNIENISVHSRITVNADTFDDSTIVLRGDGRSVLIVIGDTTLENILGDIEDFSGFKSLEISVNTTVTVDATKDTEIELLKKFGQVSGGGTLQIDSAQGVDLSEISVNNEITVEGVDDATKEPTKVENIFSLVEGSKTIVDTSSSSSSLSNAVTTTEGFTIENGQLIVNDNSFVGKYFVEIDIDGNSQTDNTKTYLVVIPDSTIDIAPTQQDFDQLELPPVE